MPAFRKQKGVLALNGQFITIAIGDNEQRRILGKIVALFEQVDGRLQNRATAAFHLHAIRDHFRARGREPTELELETLAQTWSEHCVHKTFKARISIASQPERGQDAAVIDGLLHTYLRAASEEIAAPWVRSAFVDNAGIIDFDDQFEISFKVETHNHPSAIEPFVSIKANPMTDAICREGIRYAARSLLRAYEDGSDQEARLVADHLADLLSERDEVQ